MRKILLYILLIMCTTAMAQVGEYRNRFSVGGSAGYILNKVNFRPSVIQSMYGGMTLGFTGRYTCEKYFTTLCAVQMEINLAQCGWKESITNYDGGSVINPKTGVAEKYTRNVTYIQIPILAHLSWGYEKKGFCFFFNAGPQVGFVIDENTDKNYETPFIKANFPDIYTSSTGRVNNIVAQETMPVEKKFDYGIMVGLGTECAIKRFGRVSLEGRFYYGLGTMYGDSKRDYFGNSSHMTIYIKMGYLIDLNK